MSTNSGVVGHSGANATEQYIIFAVQSIQVEGDSDRAVIAFMNANGIAYSPLVGCYKGKTEKSYLVSESDFDLIDDNGFVATQESVLHLGKMDARNRREATLIYINGELAGTQESLGTIGSVAKHVALSRDAWSYDPAQKEYFICSTNWPAFGNLEH